MRTSHTAEDSKDWEKILSWAASVVAIRGESNLNFAEVAASAGVSEDVVRAEFGSFESLKDALVDRLDGMVMECVNQEFASLPEAATPMEKIMAFAHGYLAFAERHMSDFAAHMGIDASDIIYDASGASYDQPGGLLFLREPYRLVGSLVKELMQDAGAPDDAWTLFTRSLAVMSSIHGIAHLHNFGVSRFLASSARKMLLEAVLNNLRVGLERYVVEGIELRHQPTEYAGPLPYEVVPPATEFPRSTPEEVRVAILRGAAEYGAWYGVDEISLEEAAKTAGLDPREAFRHFGTNSDLLIDLENYLDEQDQAKIGVQMFALPDGSPAIEYIKAAGFGYVGYAVSDPVGFRSLIAVSSGSIVPNSFDITSSDFDMGVAFQGLLEMVRAAIVEGGGPRSAWVLWTHAFSLWSYSHGLAQLFSNGSLRNLPVEMKFELVDAVFDVTIEGMVHGLELGAEAHA